MKKSELFQRYLIFALALFVSALGVSVITRSYLGTSPISSIPYVLSLNTPLIYKEMDKKSLNNQGGICIESPIGCTFQIVSYHKDTERSSTGLEQHVLLFCQKGHIRITSNLFQEEFLCAGEIIFVPRGSDYHSVALSDATLLIHYFNNTVCQIKNRCNRFLV